MHGTKLYKAPMHGVSMPRYPTTRDAAHLSTPVNSGCWAGRKPALDLDEVDKELEHIAETSPVDIRSELDAELDAVLLSSCAITSAEDEALDCSLSPLRRARRSSSASGASTRSSGSVGDGPRYPDPIGTPPKKSPASSDTLCSSPPATPQPAPRVWSKGEGKAHPCRRFWDSCSPSELDGLEHVFDKWLQNGTVLIARDYRSLDVAQREKESMRSAYEALLGQLSALRDYREHRQGRTAMHVLLELQG